MILLIDRVVNKILIIIVLLICFLSLYSLYDSFPIYETIKNNENVKIYNPNISSEYVNDSIVGWLEINNTTIDYPVLQGKNNTDYLSLNFKNEYSLSGSIFLDYRNEKNFDDDLNIIYGHNMSNNSMFSDLKNYKNKSFLDSHNKGTLHLRDTTFVINIILYKEVNANDDIPYNLYLYKNNFNKKVYYDLSKKNNEIKKILILSTCKKGNRSKRIIVLCELNEI